MLPQVKLDALIVRHAEIESRLSGQLGAEDFVKLSRELSDLSPVVEAIRNYRAASAELQDVEAMFADADTDGEMREIADIERRNLREKLEGLETEIRLQLLPKDAMDERSVVIEIRAGTGGDEASLFAGVLFRMYERYAAKQGWKVEIVSASEGAVGGYRKSSPTSPAAAHSRNSNMNRACIACSACLTPKPRAASTPRPRPSPCCRKRRMSISTSATTT
jgi:peptide chain release factor 1